MTTASDAADPAHKLTDKGDHLMPVPPPEQSNDATNRRAQREMRQIKRALQAEGPMELDALRTAVGGAYWDKDRFDKAVAFALDGGNVVKDKEGRYAAT